MELTTAMNTHDILERKSTQALRESYTEEPLDESLVEPDPLRQFARWFHEAIMGMLPEANATTLSTVGIDGRPKSRTVLVKWLDHDGFSFFTHMQSAKARELEVQPYAAMHFLWLPLERQVRIEGRVERLNEVDADIFFHSRPSNSRIGAWTSPQSQVIPSRAWLEEQESAFRKRFTTEKHPEGVPRSPDWGGFRLMPDRFEFWQGRTSRLHDRITYTLLSDRRWRIERLAP